MRLGLWRRPPFGYRCFQCDYVIEGHDLDVVVALARTHLHCHVGDTDPTDGPTS